jgi:integrase
MARRRAGDAKPFRRKDGLFQLDVQLGHGSRGHRVRRSLYGASADEVLAKRDELLRRQAIGLGPVDERLTVATYLRSWSDGLVGVRPRTIESYRHTVDRHLVPTLGTIALLELRAADIRRAVRTITERTGIRTAAYAVTVLRLALGVAVRDRLLERNEAAGVRRPTADLPEREVLDAAAARQLLAAVAGDRLEAMYVVALTTGHAPRRAARPALARRRHGDRDRQGHRPADVPARGRLRAHASEDEAIAPRRPPSGLALTALVEHRRRQRVERLAAGPEWRGTDLVFTTAKGGPLAGSTVVHALHRHLEAAGLPRQRFHDLRHVAATLLGPKLSRAEFLALFGWAEGSTPARYTHASSVSQRAADAMDELLAPTARSMRPRLSDGSSRSGDAWCL